jgi:hypothetical protein
VIERVFIRELRPRHIFKLIRYMIFLAFLTFWGIRESTRDEQSAYWLNTMFINQFVTQELDPSMCVTCCRYCCCLLRAIITPYTYSCRCLSNTNGCGAVVWCGVVCAL